MQETDPKSDKERVENILDVIMAYARLDFSPKTTMEGDAGILDAIGAGVNMLGEELENSTMSVREKERMLKETHHRVKNNLQIVSSLLSLQSDGISDPTVLELMHASKNRINSIAVVHEMLYQSADLKQVDASDYIRRLSQNICYSIIKPNSGVEFIYDVDEGIFFDIDRMIPLGLMLNEIITNSIKYAFPENAGKITIKLKQEDGSVVICLSDNGIGIQHNHQQNSGKLGLQLVQMLSQQLGAQLQTDTSKGTSYKITLS